MNAKEINKQILSYVCNIDAHNDYQLLLSKDKIAKKDKTKSTEFILTNNNWGAEVDVMPSLCININEINRIWEQCGTRRSHTAFVNLISLEKIMLSGSKNIEHDQLKYNKYIVHDKNEADDIEVIKLEVNRQFNTYGIPFFQEYASVEGVQKLLNTDLTQEWNPYCAGFHVRSIVGLIAAKLCKDANYADISDFYTTGIMNHHRNQTMDTEDVSIFFKVRDFLSEMTI